MDEGTSSGGKDLKGRLKILEDESGLELSLGLSCGGGEPSSNGSTEKKKKASESGAATTINSGDARDQGFWLEGVRRKSMESGSAVLSQGQGLQWTAQSAGRTGLGDPLTDEQLATAWSQLSKQASGVVLDPSKHAGFQAVGMNLAKLLAAKNRTQQPAQQQSNGAEMTPEEGQELEQQKRIYQQQEARKKRKMAIDEKKRDENGPDATETLGVGVGVGQHQLHRAPSIGTFQAAPSMNAFMRRTISEPVIPTEDMSITNSKDKAGTLAGVGPSTNEPAVEAGQQNGTEETKTPASWQLGTTKDIPPVDKINPELSIARPGSVPVGGNGTSADLPWVSATANGKTINGVVYRMYQGQYKVVCTCHGLHLSPQEFVKHADQLEPVKEPEPAKVLGGGTETISTSSQVS